MQRFSTIEFIQNLKNVELTHRQPKISDGHNLRPLKQHTSVEIQNSHQHALLDLSVHLPK